MASPSTVNVQTPFPESVGKYELLLPIGTGGMATVYLARSTGAGGFERDVALKLVHAHLRADEESKVQLLEEAKLAARIRHPNVVPVLEVDEDPFGLFLVMDYVEGDTLSGLVRAAKNSGRRLTWRLAARILNDALLGLHAAHELKNSSGSPLNLVHRDFSPQNILLSIQGMTRLGDFGVAKAADRAVRTKTGLIKGKISYMSPEQARGHHVDRRCDVWAAGVVAWELLAGRRLHASEDDVSTLLSIVTQHPPRLSSVCADIPKALDDALEWALTPDVEERCPTAEALRVRLEEAWNAGDGIATTQELSEFVTAVTKEKLADRGTSIDEVRSLRRRMDQLTRTPLEELSSNPTASSTKREARGHGEATRSPSSPSLLTGAGILFDREATSDGSELLIAEEATTTSAVVPSVGNPASGTRWVWLGLGALGLLGAGAFIFREAASETDSAAQSQVPRATTSVDSTSDSRAAPVQLAPEPSPAPTQPAFAAPKPTAKAKSPTLSPRPNTKKRRKRSVPAEQTGGTTGPRRPSKPGLATSPYGKPKSTQ